MKCKIGNICEINSSTLKKDNLPKEIYYLDTSSVTEGHFENPTKLIIGKDKVPSRARRKVKKNDIVYSTVRPVQRHYGFIRENEEHLIVSTGFAVLTPDETKIDPYYLYCFLTLHPNIEHLQTIAENSTSAYPSIKPKDISELEIDLPNLDTQKSISNFLRNINEKINLNNQIISNLEEFAQAVFKRWFIDFEFPNEDKEPYRSSGGKMVDSEIGLIPEEWEVGSLSDLGDVVGGGTPSKKVEEYYTDHGVGWITPKDLSSDKSIFIEKGAIDITEEALQKSSAKLLPEDSVLFSSRAPIGYVAIAGKPLSTNQGFKSMVPNSNIPSEFVFFLLKHLTPAIEANAGGSTFNEISGKGIKGIISVIPDEKVLALYHENVHANFSYIKELEKENRNLTSLRASLLPKLLSGEIELNDESEVLEDAMV